MGWASSGDSIANRSLDACLSASLPQSFHVCIPSRYYDPDNIFCTLHNPVANPLSACFSAHHITIRRRHHTPHPFGLSALRDISKHNPLHAIAHNLCISVHLGYPPCRTTRNTLLHAIAHTIYAYVFAHLGCVPLHNNVKHAPLHVVAHNLCISVLNTIQTKTLFTS